MTKISPDQNIIRNFTLNLFKIQEDKPSQAHLIISITGVRRTIAVVLFLPLECMAYKNTDFLKPRRRCTFMLYYFQISSRPEKSSQRIYVTV